MKHAQANALVTGANRGLGFEIARQLAQRGFHVLLTSRDVNAGKEAAAKLRQSGGAVTFVALDVASPVSIREAAQSVAAQCDHLDVLINNAAILESESEPVFEITAERMQRTLQTNTTGPLLVAQAFLPLLMKSKRGRIINVSSSAGSLHKMSAYAPSYSISKTALNAVTVQLAVAMSTHDIAVNSVCPGWVRTDMGGAHAPLSVAEGVDTILWLATEAPQELTGQFVRERKIIAW